MKESNSSEETYQLGISFVSGLRANTVIALFGDLGVGKTTFMKGLVHGLTGVLPDEINSPTFTYLNIYQGKLPVFHFDLYRLRTVEDFQDLGFHEYFQAGGICCLEWPERIANLLPKHTIHIRFQHAGGDRRAISFPV